MEIKIQECEATDGGVAMLADMALSKDAGKWLKSIVKGTSRWYPVWVSVTINGIREVVQGDGQTPEESMKVVRKVKRLPKSVRMLPNDRAIVEADIFESELHITLD